MEKVKSLKELTEDEFNKLKKAGLLKTIYPDAPNEFKEIKGVKPEPLKNPNFSSLVKMCENYLMYKQDPENHRMKDGEHYIFEEAIKCVYGNNKDSGVWDFINKNS